MTNFNDNTTAQFDDVFDFENETVEAPEAMEIDLAGALNGEYGPEEQAEAQAYIGAQVPEQTEAQAAEAALSAAFAQPAEPAKRKPGRPKGALNKHNAEAQAKLEKERASRPDWMKDLHFVERKGQDVLDKTFLSNIRILLMNYKELKDTFTRNEFTREVSLTKPLELSGVTFPEGIVSPLIYNALRVYFEEEFEVTFSEENVYAGVAQAALRNCTNPVLDYVKRCRRVYEEAAKKFPGRDFISGFFPATLGAEQTEAVALSTKILLAQMCSKAYNPYSSAEFAIDTIGSQGVGKTRVFTALFTVYQEDQMNEKIGHVLGDAYITTNVSRLDDKDAQLRISKSWGLIDDELEITRRASFEEMKAFLSTTSFDIRAAYAKGSERVPRSAVVVRTTNETDYLKDKSGQRRFLPIMANKKAKTRDISDFEVWELMAMIGQAEAMTQYDLPEKERHNKGLFEPQRLAMTDLAMFEEERKSFSYESIIDSTVDQYLQIKVPVNWDEWLPNMRKEYIQDQLNGVNRTHYFGQLGNAFTMQMDPNATRNFKVEELKQRDYVTVNEILDEALDQPNNNSTAKKVKYALKHHPMIDSEKRITVNGRKIRVFTFDADYSENQNQN